MARSKRTAPEINASSMADIAFLLLIFFLVTTTIDTDKGIIHKLPPWDPEQEQEDIDINRRNVLIVLVNAQDYLLVNGNYEKVSNLRKRIKEFIDNRGRNPEMSVSPQKAIVSLQNDRGTSYNMYIQVQNESKAAYRELREEFSMKKFGKSFDKLSEDQAKVVRDEYPLKISEADPKAIGEAATN